MRKRAWGCLVLAALLAFSWAVQARPDLTISNLRLDPADPMGGTQAELIATIENVGEDPVEDSFYVLFEADGQELDTVLVSRDLAAGETREVSASWIATGGPHILEVQVDHPFTRISEVRETNNMDSLTVFVPFGELAAQQLSLLRIVVAEFDDRSNTGFVNMGRGIADKLAARLAESGARVIEPGELEAVMQEQNLNPDVAGDVTRAARVLGVDLLISGVIETVDLQEASVNLGFLRVSGASVDVKATARMVDVGTAEILTAVSAEGHEEGSTGFSVDLGNILNLSEADSVCAGGLRTDRPLYYMGNPIPVGYKNTSLPGWFSLEIYTGSGTFLRWLGWQYIETGGCGRWFWDQMDALGAQMSPGFYLAKLWNGASYVATTTFQIQPGFSFSVPPAREITVGEGPFESTIVGSAVNQAVGQLASSLLTALADPAMFPPSAESAALPVAGTAAEPARSMVEAPREGQVAAILPDGRIAINVGARSGIAVGDRFEILEAENLVLHPQSLEVLAYDVLSVKGEMTITEVRDRVSYGVRSGDFEPLIGDVARRVDR